jgi:two-component system response regulator AtoC
VASGSFREDLLYRMNAITLELPPLRERPEEIVPLARLFLVRAAQRWQRPAREFTPAALELLSTYHWPGNVRQLRNVVERGVLLSDEALLDAEQLSTKVSVPAAIIGSEPSLEALASGTGPRTLPPGFTGLRDALRDYEAQLIGQALEQADGNQTRAAELLEVPRRTLVRKLQALRQRDDCGISE